MLYLFVWWALLLLLGLAALPVTLRFLRFLPDRGYAFSKPLALLLWAFPFWALATFRFLQNSQGALAAIAVVLALVSWGLWRGRGPDSVLAWLRAHWRYALAVELVFAAAFLGFAFFRAYNPEISATEKPMEYMFLNSILASDTFPPRDAWLAGYSISYYYLGYVIVAALARLGSIPSSYAFNLGLIMTFALAAVSAFGLCSNAVAHAQSERAVSPDGSTPAPRSRPSTAPFVFGILAIFLLLIIGNLEGAFEVGYNAGIGPRATYAVLNLHKLEDVEPSGTLPQDNWWWWRASRVLNDKSPADAGPVEVIDEFPAFSFLLGDLHPHVLALPFGLLALGVALNLLLSSVEAVTRWDAVQRVLLAPRILLTALIVGALGMLNTWDIVTYGLILVATFALSQYRSVGRVTPWLVGSVTGYFVILFGGAYLLFLPFYLGFSSQARGIAPNIFGRTPAHQYLIMFGLFVFVFAGLVALLLRQREQARLAGDDGPDAFPEIATWAAGFIAVPVLIAAAGLALLSIRPELRDQLSGVLGGDPQNLAGALLARYSGSFVASPGTFLLLVALLACLLALGRQLLLRQGHTLTARSPLPTTLLFFLLLAVVGFLLTFGVEFLYIRDTFETRMNTVFKLYYQAWALLAVSAAFAVYYIWRTARGAARPVWLGAFGVLLVLSMIYPTLAVPSRANAFQADPQSGIPTLDGWRWVRQYHPDDYAAIEWTRSNVPPGSTILEAAGQQYTFDNRVSVATGLPTVLGWGGHELQWRGNFDQAGPRERDIQTIYSSRDLNTTRELLGKYDVQYVVVGGIERDRYKLSQALVDKFARLGDLVFDQGSMRIYHVGVE